MLCSSHSDNEKWLARRKFTLKALDAPWGGSGNQDFLVLERSGTAKNWSDQGAERQGRRRYEVTKIPRAQRWPVPHYCSLANDLIHKFLNLGFLLRTSQPYWISRSLNVHQRQPIFRENTSEVMSSSWSAMESWGSWTEGAKVEKAQSLLSYTTVLTWKSDAKGAALTSAPNKAKGLFTWSSVSSVNLA